MLKKLLFVVLLALASVAQAAVYSLPWGPKPQFVDANGAPMSSGSLLTFAGGSSTPQVSYTDSTGGVANPTTITLNTRGETPNEVWLTGGQTYKFVLKDSAGATVWTVDGVTGVNDTTSSQSEWIAGPAPTFVGTTSFTLAGDQTVEFHKGRRLRTTNSGGTVYSTIVSSVFGASTTVTVANDASVLDSGLSAVSYGIVRAVNPSISPDMSHRKGTAVTSAATTDIWSIVGDYVHVTGTVTITSFGTAPYAGAERTVIFDGALTLTHNAATLLLPTGANITTAANDRIIVRADTTANMVVVSYVQASGLLGVNGEFRSSQIFTGSGTYTTPAGLKRAKVTVVGGGGGGGGCGATSGGTGCGAGGGAGAGMAVKLLSAVTIGVSQTVTIGAGGLAGATGSTGGTGGTTSFGALLTATGGTGGVGSSAQSGPAPGGPGGQTPGTGSSGDYNLTGQAGGVSFVASSTGIGGIGGSSPMGGGGAAVSASTTSAGTVGGNYGGGAGGSALGQSQSATVGSAGAPGIVIVDEYFLKAANDERWIESIGLPANDERWLMNGTFR